MKTSLCCNFSFKLSRLFNSLQPLSLSSCRCHSHIINPFFYLLWVSVYVMSPFSFTPASCPLLCLGCCRASRPHQGLRCLTDPLPTITITYYQPQAVYRADALKVTNNHPIDHTTHTSLLLLLIIFLFNLFFYPPTRIFWMTHTILTYTCAHAIDDKVEHHIHTGPGEIERRKLWCPRLRLIC